MSSNNNICLVSFVKISWRHSFLFFVNHNSENRLDWSFWLYKRICPIPCIVSASWKLCVLLRKLTCFSNVSLLVLDPFYISFSIMSFQFYGIKLNWSLAKLNRVETIFWRRSVPSFDKNLTKAHTSYLSQPSQPLVV